MVEPINAFTQGAHTALTHKFVMGVNNRSQIVYALVAVWDAGNTSSDSTPPDWFSYYYWTSTQRGAGHCIIYLHGSDTYDRGDNNNYNVALSVM